MASTPAVARWSLAVSLVALVALAGCSSTPVAEPALDAAAPTDAAPPPVMADAAPLADAGATDAARPDAAVPPPGPTEFPAFEGALVLYANGGKFFGYKAIAKSLDTDASKVEAATNTYSAYFDDSANHVLVTLPNLTPGTLDLTAGGLAKVDVLVVGDDRAEGLLTAGKLEVVEATNKKVRARFYGEVGGVKVHGALDVVLAP